MPPGYRPPVAPPGRPPSKNTKIVIGVVAGATAVAVLLTLALFGLANKTSDAGSTDNGEVSDQQRAANATVAEDSGDFDAVCGRGSVSNAGDFVKPYKILAFSTAEIANSWSEVSLDNDAEYYAGTAPPSAVNVVACLSVKPGSEVKSGTCDYDSGGDVQEIDRYAVEYDVEVHEAKTGRSIENLGSVEGPAKGCPTVALFDENSPKIYGSPDRSALADKLSDFAAG